MGVTYAGGPFMVGAAVQQFRAKDAVATYSKNTEYGIGASYDFTAAKLYTHYIANDFQTPNAKPLQQFGLGVTAPFGAFTLGGQYAYNYYKAGTNSKAKGHDFVLQGTYALSKRTDVYARAARTDSWKVKTSGTTAYKTNTDSFAVGVRHRF